MRDFFKVECRSRENGLRGRVFIGRYFNATRLKLLVKFLSRNEYHLGILMPRCHLVFKIFALIALMRFCFLCEMHFWNFKISYKVKSLIVDVIKAFLEKKKNPKRNKEKKRRKKVNFFLFYYFF